MATATISFGLVSVPVPSIPPASPPPHQLQHAAQDVRHPSEAAIHLPQGQRVVERDEIAKGYEFAKGQYVIFSPGGDQGSRREGHQRHRHQRVRSPRRGRPALPREGLLSWAPTRAASGPIGCWARRSRTPAARRLGQYSARGKQYLVLVRPLDGVLVMEQLHYAAELRARRRCPIPDTPVKDAELALARQLIEQSVHRRVPPRELSRHRAGSGARGHSAEGRRPGDHRGAGSQAGDQDHRPDGRAEGEPGSKREAGAAQKKSAKSSSSETSKPAKKRARKAS